eukprot:56176-Chlamydomonas_euryale.AAC.1
MAPRAAGSVSEFGNVAGATHGLICCLPPPHECSAVLPSCHPMNALLCCLPPPHECSAVLPPAC